VSAKTRTVDRRKWRYWFVIFMHVNPLWGRPRDLFEKNPYWLTKGGTETRSLTWWRIQQVIFWTFFFPTAILYWWPGMVISLVILERGWEYQRTFGWFTNALVYALVFPAILSWLHILTGFDWYIGWHVAPSFGPVFGGLLSVVWFANLVIVVALGFTLSTQLLGDLWKVANNKEVKFIN
jgi:hypothetical protein